MPRNDAVDVEFQGRFVANDGLGDTRSISVTTSRRRFVVFLWVFFVAVVCDVVGFE